MPYPTYPAVSVPDVPTRSLEHYLDFWESERGAVRSLQNPAWAQTPYHAEWDINVRVPKLWAFEGVTVQSRELRAWSAGSGMGAVGQPLGTDPTALINTQASIVLVSATWAQRAANALRATLSTPLIQVDGIVGPATIAALRLAMLYWYANFSSTVMQSDMGQTSIGGLPMPTRSGSGMALAANFAQYLGTLTQVADPPRPAPTPTPTPTPVPTPPAADPTPPSSSGGLLFIGFLGLVAVAVARSR